MKSKLLLFTDSYPYSHHETFLHDEVQHLSKSFDEIIIQPLVWTEAMRQVPDNVRVFKGLYKKKSYFWVLIKGLLSFAPIGKLKEVFSDHFIQGLGQYFIARGVYNLPGIRDYLEDESFVKYFYWGKGSASLCVFFPTKGKTVVRLHGYDLYGPDVRKGNVIPLRQSLIKQVRDFVFISEHGRKYFEKTYQTSGSLYRLGINYSGKSPDRSPETPFTIVSCSTLIPLKRVPAIARVISRVKYNIQWIHIGDGPEKVTVDEVVKAFPANVKVRFLGQLKHQEVIQFYLNNHVDAFISLSETEGLPFSMMEALSFSVPILATDVGGVSEIVTKETGFLFPKDFDENEVAQKIEMLIDMPSQQHAELRSKALEAYWKSFSSETNYTEFIAYLKS